MDTCATCDKFNIVIRSDPNDIGARQQLARVIRPCEVTKRQLSPACPISHVL